MISTNDTCIIIDTGKYNLNHEYDENINDSKYCKYKFIFNNNYENDKIIHINITLSLPGTILIKNNDLYNSPINQEVHIFNYYVPLEDIKNKNYNDYLGEEEVSVWNYLNMAGALDKCGGFENVDIVQKWLYCINTTLVNAIEDNLENHEDMTHLYNFFNKSSVEKLIKNNKN